MSPLTHQHARPCTCLSPPGDSLLLQPHSLGPCPVMSSWGAHPGPPVTSPCPNRLFFRKHYPVSSVIFCALDPQDRK